MIQPQFSSSSNYDAPIDIAGAGAGHGHRSTDVLFRKELVKCNKFRIYEILKSNFEVDMLVNRKCLVAEWWTTKLRYNGGT
jgi:hypothetical protein